MRPIAPTVHPESIKSSLRQPGLDFRTIEVGESSHRLAGATIPQELMRITGQQGRIELQGLAKSLIERRPCAKVGAEENGKLHFPGTHDLPIERGKVLDGVRDEMRQANHGSSRL